MSSSTTNQSGGRLPEAIAGVCDVMSTYPGRWALCGGWAVDAWLGRITREHGDIDISVFVDEQHALYDHLSSWQLLAHDDAWEPGGAEGWWDGTRSLSFPSHIHARPPERSGLMPKNGIATVEDGFELDIQVDDRTGDEWLLHREPDIVLPFDRALRIPPWGIPTAAPEVLLFFKSQALRRRDKADFEALLPLLTVDQRGWLRGAIAALGHPWERKLAS